MGISFRSLGGYSFRAAKVTDPMDEMRKDQKLFDDAILATYDNEYGTVDLSPPPKLFGTNCKYCGTFTKSNTICKGCGFL